VLNNWETKLFAGKIPTEATIYVKDFKPQNKSVILRNVPIDISEDDIKSELLKQYESLIKVRRFMKNGKALRIAKIDFTNEQDKVKILQNGLFLENLFISPEDYKSIKNL